MKSGEYGITCNFNVNYNVASFTALSIKFTRPDASVLTVTNGAVTVGSSPLVTPDGTYAANQYLIYTFVAGDINQSGNYSVVITYTDATKKLIADTIVITIL